MTLKKNLEEQIAGMTKTKEENPTNSFMLTTMNTMITSMTVSLSIITILLNDK
jgi:carbohydrate-binding DOMON domain-containing protein